MHAFQTAASAFCIACICAEITTLLAGRRLGGQMHKSRCRAIYSSDPVTGWPRQMKLELKSAAAAAPAAVSIQSTETSLLQGAQERLEADLCAECERRFGTKVKLEITLTRTEQTVRAEKVLVILPGGVHIRRAEPDRGISAAGAWHGTDTGSTGGHRMKEAGAFVRRFRERFCPEMQRKQGRARLAAAVGVLAMLLILLSELFPQNTAAGSTKNTKSAQSSTEYQAQLENRLEHLISQMSGAGKTTVMVTLETGEEAIYALDTQSGEMQSQQTHVLLEDGSALTETVCLPQVCGVAVLCEGGGDIRVAARITELVSALLDLPSNRICVEQRKG